ncbi:MAG: GDSL-type esterase/lipase family protein, partial [Acidimicrobiales bacterium]
LVAVTLACSACGSSSQGRSGSAPSGVGKPSVVVLGDSIASGEGIAYGYTYDSSSSVLRWQGGVASPVWDPPYANCHVTEQAYGDVVAKALRANLANFACTGATYSNGIVGARTVGGVVYRPAELGDWATGQELNAAYDRASPDVVLISLGADDIRFSQIAEDCIVASVLDPAVCTASDPGQTVQSDMFAQLPTLGANYRSLVAAIQARGARAHKIPYIVFTTYPNPLPAPGADIDVTRCPDSAHLSSAQISYLSSLFEVLKGVIANSVGGEKGVSVADVSRAFAGHQLCSLDPWAYGPSVLIFSNPQSQAPYHPTPAGQEAIAHKVLSVLPAKFKG